MSGPFSAQKLTWGRMKADSGTSCHKRITRWSLERLPVLWQILSGRNAFLGGHLGGRAGSISECWARLGRASASWAEGVDEKASVYSHFGCSFISRGWLCSLCRVLPYGSVAGTWNECNGMLLVECETEISSGKIGGTLPRLWESRLLIHTVDTSELIFTERRSAFVFFFICSSFKIPYLPSSCCRNTQTHDITFLFGCGSNKEVKIKFL